MFTAALLMVTLSVYAEHYQIDPAETKTTYATKYLGIIPVHGVFERMTGVLRYDTSKPPAERDAYIHVVIDATTLRPMSFDTDAKRKMLRGPDFFNVEKFPTIEFVSTLFRFDGSKLIAIDGALTMKGVTRTVSLVVRESGCVAAAPPQPARCTASAEVVVKRAEFGMTNWAATVSDTVKIGVELVAVAVAEATAPGDKLPDKKSADVSNAPAPANTK